MKKIKVKNRNLTNEEKYKIAEFLVDEYNDTFGCEDPDTQLTMEELYDDFDDAALLTAYDMPNGEVYIVFISFFDLEDDGQYVDKAIDEFVIGSDGIVQSANY